MAINLKERDKIEACINELSYDKRALRKAYNYYHCVRDPEQYKYLEDNYGIGTPTSVTFTPLIKKHIDVLVGEYLELDPDLSVSCKDEHTVTNIMRDKQLKIDKAVFDECKKRVDNDLISILIEGKEPVQDPFFVQQIEKLKEDVANNYVSDYEIAAQNILNYIRHSRDIDLKNKMRELYTDLLVGGLTYYRVRPNMGGTGLNLEILNPLDTFIERNHNEYYLNKSPRACYRKWMTADQILVKYGKELTREDKEKLKDKNKIRTTSNQVHYVEVPTALFEPKAMFDRVNILDGLETVSRSNLGTESRINNIDFIEVWECEWIEEDGDRLTRHEGVRINEDIYITRGESKDITRSISNPKDCTLSINGIFFNDKNGNPFSIVLNTSDLQDRYDLIVYYRDALIAASGAMGDWVDVAHLPSFLGEDIVERVRKWIAYKKNGLAMFDSSQEGTQVVNTTFNGYDDTLKAQAIQAFEIALQSIEQQASSITGVFAEKLGGIQQRDAVSNVKVGIKQSTLLTKQYFTAMDLLYKEVNYDLLNLAKIVYKSGISGTLINGMKLNEIFTALPQYYTMTDFDIHIKDSSEIFQAKEGLRQVGAELVKAGAADVEMLVDIMMASNMTELKQYVKSAVHKQKEENNAISQLQQQLQQMQEQAKQMEQQMNQMTEENKKLQTALEKNNQEKMELEKRRIDIEEQKVRDTRDYNDRIVKNKERQTELEFVQIYDGNPYNDKIKNN